MSKPISNQVSPAPPLTEEQRKKMKKRMTKVLTKLWDADGANIFYDAPTNTTTSTVESNFKDCLNRVGSRLDRDKYDKDHGWTSFARDLGFVYGRNAAFLKGKGAKTALQHLDLAAGYLAKIDPSLAEVVRGAALQEQVSSPDPKHSRSKKRKNSSYAEDKFKDIPASELTIEQREERAHSTLVKFIEDLGGTAEQVESIKPKVVQRKTGKFDTIFVLESGKSCKSKNEVATVLGLNGDSLLGQPALKKQKTKRAPMPRNSKDAEAEKRRLKKELDKLLKSHAKATKAVDDFIIEHQAESAQIDDNDLIKLGGSASQKKITDLRPDMNQFPEIPQQCMPELLMTWDFVTTFSKSISVEPISLENFILTLTYKEPHKIDDNDEISEVSPAPVYLAEVHLGLLKLLLLDPSSDEWWWSTLPEPEDVLPANIPAAQQTAPEDIAPSFKFDLGAIINEDEDSQVTLQWIEALDSIRDRKAKAAGAIKTAIKNASSITTNKLVKEYLRKAMKRWKKYSGSFPRHAALWLVNKMRDARPDLYGREMSVADLTKQKISVVESAGTALDGNEESESDGADDTDSGIHDGLGDGSDDESEEEDDESEEEEETEVLQRVEFSGPPTLVDLLLPPSKPVPKSDIISALTWPSLVGAFCRRILYQYRKNRSEVDDNIRRAKVMKPLHPSQHTERLAIAASRIFMESAIGDDESPVEVAIDKLCRGESYEKLSNVEKIAVLRILIEAAYDTLKVSQCVEDNFMARINAMKALETEEKRARKEAREEQSQADSEARERLLTEARTSFYQKWRTKIGVSEDEFLSDPAGVAEGLSGEAKSDFDKLPQPKSFSRAKVTQMVTQIQEEKAFDTHSLFVLSLDEIVKRDEEQLTVLNEELSQIPSNEEDREREVTILYRKLNREKRILEEDARVLPEFRAGAIEELQDAMEAGTIKSLRAAIRSARQAKLIGEEDDGSVWAHELVRDANIELRAAEKRRRVTEAQKELVSKRNKCFIRTEPIGRDRYYNNFWHFSGSVNPLDIWVEHSDSKSSLGVGPSEYWDDFMDTEESSENAAMKQFVCKEFDCFGDISSLPSTTWSCFTSEAKLKKIIKLMDDRGTREAQLKDKLKEISESGDKVADVASDVTLKHSNDESIFATEKRNHMGDDIELITNINSAIGERVRRREDEESYFQNGSIVGWFMMKPASIEPEENGSSLPQDFPIWRVALDEGGEVDLRGFQVVEGIIRYQKWYHKIDSYIERDARYFSYRNSLGRFCGRATDAPFSMTPFALSKLMLKKESDIYNSLKTYAYSNTWGGKAGGGARNSWRSMLEDEGHKFDMVKSSLLVLENAVFDLILGIMNANTDEAKPNQLEQLDKSLLDDPNFRKEIELESLNGALLTGLWNSSQTRAVFLTIMENATDVSFLALGLDLLSRNAEAYLIQYKSSIGRGKKNHSTTRRQTSSLYEPDDYVDEVGYDDYMPTTRSTRRKNVSYTYDYSALDYLE